MAFDGIGYRDAPLGYPILAHPKAPLTGPAYGNALRIAYCYAINHGRRIIEQHYPVNFRDPQGFGDDRMIASTSFVRIADGNRYIPDSVTHLVAEAIYNVTSIDDDSIAYHRIAITNGTDTDTGSTVETQLSIQPVSRGNVGPYDPFGSRYQRYVTRCEVGLSAVSAGASREVYVQAYALRGSSAAAYWPQWIGVWTEIR